MTKQAILIGCGGHAKSLLALNASSISVNPIHAYSCYQPTDSKAFKQLTFMLEAELTSQDKNQHLINGIGLSISASSRRTKFSRLLSLGFSKVNLISNFAHIDNSSSLGDGIQIFHNVIVQADSRIGDDVVLGSGSIVEHDAVIGSGTFVCPGALIMGGVNLAEDVTIFAGAIVLPGISIGQGAVIGAGTIVLKNVPPGETVVGNPGRSLGDNHGQ